MSGTRQHAVREGRTVFFAGLTSEAGRQGKTKKEWGPGVLAAGLGGPLEGWVVIKI